MITTRPLRIVVDRPPVAAVPLPAVGSAGLGVRPLRFPAPFRRKVGTIGYSLGAKDAVLPPAVGSFVVTPLHARALLLADPDGGRVAFVFIEAWSATRYLHEAAAARTASIGIGVDRLVLVGVHSHTTPAGVCGNSFYDLLGGNLDGFDAPVADAWAEAIAGAVHDAHQDLAPARIGVAVHRVWGAVSNRSLAAFHRNAEAGDWNRAPFPGQGAPAGLGAEQRAIDPRVTALAVVGEDERLRGVFAVVNGHATALGKTVAALSGDWPAYAASRAREALGGPVVAVGAGCSGDLSPLGIGAPVPWPEQGDGLVVHAGERLAVGIVEAASAARRALVDVTVRTAWAEWAPTPTPPTDLAGLAPFDLGFVSMGGAEDGPTAALRALGRPFVEGSADASHPDPRQRPKISARAFVEGIIGRRVPLAPSPVHPTHVVDVSGHRFVTVPAEPTVHAAWSIERATGGTVLGYAGDYAGYLVTPEEFDAQHYEGSSCLYGRNALRVLREHLVALAAGGAAPVPGAVVFDTASALKLAPFEPPDPNEPDAVGAERSPDGYTAWRRAAGAGGDDIDAIAVHVHGANGAVVVAHGTVEVRRLPLPGQGTRVVFVVDLPAAGLPPPPRRLRVPAGDGWPAWEVALPDDGP